MDPKGKSSHESKRGGYRLRGQPTVTFPIGDHVNVLHFAFLHYRKTGPSKIMKLLICRCHHIIDMLIEFSKSLILLTHLKCLNVPMFFQFLHELQLQFLTFNRI